MLQHRHTLLLPKKHLVLLVASPRAPSPCLQARALGTAGSSPPGSPSYGSYLQPDAAGHRDAVCVYVMALDVVNEHLVDPRGVAGG